MKIVDRPDAASAAGSRRRLWLVAGLVLVVCLGLLARVIPQVLVVAPVVIALGGRQWLRRRELRKAGRLAVEARWALVGQVTPRDVRSIGRFAHLGGVELAGGSGYAVIEPADGGLAFRWAPLMGEVADTRIKIDLLELHCEDGNVRSAIARSSQGELGFPVVAGRAPSAELAKQVGVDWIQTDHEA